MRWELVLATKFERANRRFVRCDRQRQERIDEALRQMEEDVFAASLGTHKLSGTLAGLRACAWVTIVALYSHLNMIQIPAMK